MRFALFKYGFKAGFRDVTDKQLNDAAMAGAVLGAAAACIILTAANGS